MNGMINTQMAKESPQQPGQRQSSPADDAGLSGEPSDQQLEGEVKKVYLAGVKMLYDDKAHQHVVAELQSMADNPPYAIASTAFSLMQTLDEKSGGKIPGEALIPAAIDLLDDVGKIARGSQAVPVDSNTLPQALQYLVAIAVEAGVIDGQEIQELIGEMPEEEVQQMVAQQQQIAAGQPVAA